MSLRSPMVSVCDPTPCCASLTVTDTDTVMNTAQLITGHATLLSLLLSQQTGKAALLQSCDMTSLIKHSYLRLL